MRTAGRHRCVHHDLAAASVTVRADAAFDTVTTTSPAGSAAPGFPVPEVPRVPRPHQASSLRLRTRCGLRGVALAFALGSVRLGRELHRLDVRDDDLFTRRERRFRVQLLQELRRRVEPFGERFDDGLVRKRRQLRLVRKLAWDLRLERAGRVFGGDLVAGWSVLRPPGRRRSACDAPPAPSSCSIPPGRRSLRARIRRGRAPPGVRARRLARLPGCVGAGIWRPASWAMSSFPARGRAVAPDAPARAPQREQGS